MCGTSLYYYPPHCTGCRCFESWFTTTTTLELEYQPRHRKPGPAQ